MRGGKYEPTPNSSCLTLWHPSAKSFSHAHTILFSHNGCNISTHCTRASALPHWLSPSSLFSVSKLIRKRSACGRANLRESWSYELDAKYSAKQAHQHQLRDMGIASTGTFGQEPSAPVGEIRLTDFPDRSVFRSCNTRRSCAEIERTMITGRPTSRLGKRQDVSLTFFFSGQLGAHMFSFGRYTSLQETTAIPHRPLIRSLDRRLP